MSAEEPTTPGDGSTTKVSPEEDWNALECRTGGTATENEKSSPSQAESEDEEKKGPERRRSRRVRPLLAMASALIVVALASIAAAALVGGDTGHGLRPRSRAVHVKSQEAAKRRSSRARWAGGASGSLRTRREREGHGLSRAGRHAHRRRKPRSPTKQAADIPGEPPVYGSTAPEPPPQPSTPASRAPSAPKQEPGLRDGATESTEFGL
jgi:hypothetical protein